MLNSMNSRPLDDGNIEITHKFLFNNLSQQNSSKKSKTNEINSVITKNQGFSIKESAVLE